MKVLGIIPARAGSTRLPQKNKLPLAGKPLISYVVAAALGSRMITDWVLSTDDAEILELALGWEGIRPLNRPVELAGKASPAIDYVRHALDTYAKEGVHFDAIAIVQPTSPFTLSEDIDQTIQLLVRSGAPSAVTVMKLDHVVHPLKLKRLNGDRLEALIEEERGRMASEDLDEVYVRNGAVYASRTSIIEQGILLGEDCRAVVMPRERSLDINEKLDFEFAEFLLSSQST